MKSHSFIFLLTLCSFFILQGLLLHVASEESPDSSLSEPSPSPKPLVNRNRDIEYKPTDRKNPNALEAVKWIFDDANSAAWSGFSGLDPRPVSMQQLISVQQGTGYWDGFAEDQVLAMFYKVRADCVDENGERGLFQLVVAKRVPYYAYRVEEAALVQRPRDSKPPPHIQKLMDESKQTLPDDVEFVKLKPNQVHSL